MSSLSAEKAFRASIKNLAFPAAYYLYGEDDYRKDEAVRELVNVTADPSTRDFNVEFLRGADVTAEALGSTVGTPPMMADRRVVVIREVSALKKDARGELDRYLAKPASDLVLVLTVPAGVHADKALMGSCLAVDFAPLSEDRVPKWIAYYAEHTLRCTITSDAVTLLHSAVGGDLGQLRLELDKLASFTGGGEIDERSVSEVVGVRRDETMGALLDAISRRDASQALALLTGVLQQPKTSAVTIIMALATQMLAIGWARAARDRGTPAGRISGELFTLLKECGSAYTGRPWGEAIAAWSAAINRWSSSDVDGALEALLDADYGLKESRVSSDEQLLASLILKLCSAPSHRRAA